MTLSDDFAPMEEEEQEEQSPYPSAFGITFSPMIIGILLGIVGLGGAIAMFIYLIQPAMTELNELETQVNSKDQERLQLEQAQQQINTLRQELQTLQNQRQEVLSLFSDEESLNTLLLNLNSQIQQEGELVKYDPSNEEPQLISDGSWGVAVNNLLKNQKYEIEIAAPFEETLNILRSLERLQTLVVVNNLNTDIREREARIVNPDGSVVIEGRPTLNTSFELEVLFPVSEEELAEQQAAQEAAQAAEGEAGAEGQPPAQ